MPILKRGLSGGIVLNDEIKQNAEIDEDEQKVLDPLELTDRDIAIFRLAHEHRYIVYSQIREGFWKERSVSAKAPNKRVQRLVRSGFLSRGYSEMKNLNCYMVTEKSLSIMKERGLDSGLKLYEPTPRFDRSIDHDLKLLNLRLVFRDCGLDCWRSERILRESEHLKRIPDGVLNVGGNKVAIEFENGPLSKSIARYQEMFAYYNQHEAYALFFLIVDGNVKDWLIRVMEYDPQRVWITTYKEMMRKRENAVFENKAASFTLHEIL